MSAQPLPGLLAHLAPVLDHYGYLAVGGFIALEDFGIPVTSCAPPRPSQHDKHNCHQALALVSQSEGIDCACPSQCPSTAVTTTGSVFDIMPLKCSGAKGTRTPGLLHAMQVRQPACQGISDTYLRRWCTGVPVSACQSAGDGCPLGCPHPSTRGCSKPLNVVANSSTC